MHKKYADLSNGGLFWKSLVASFRRTYALSVGFKMKPLRKDVFQCLDINQTKFCDKTTIYFHCLFDESHFQTSVLSIRDNECIMELNWLWKHIKKVRSSQPAIIVLNWIKYRFSLWVSLTSNVNKDIEKVFICFVGVFNFFNVRR